MEKEGGKTAATIVTVEKYISRGKFSRVVIRTEQNNYLLDLPLNSFTARSVSTAAISIIKAFSFVFHDFNVAVVKFRAGSLI